LEASRPGTPSRTARGPTVRWELKAAAGKRPTRGTRTAREAATCGRGSVGVRSPVASGTRRCRGSGDGRQVTRLPLGARSTGLRRGRPRGCPPGGQKSAEGAQDRRRDPRPAQVPPARGPPSCTADDGARHAETRQRPGTAAAGSRPEPGGVRHTGPADPAAIGPQPQPGREPVRRREPLTTDFTRVQAHPGGAGLDGMTVEALPADLRKA
jgi:hypothetical protein